MPKCVIGSCNNSSYKYVKSNGLSFHRFPSKLGKLKKWIEAIRIQLSDNNWVPSAGHRVCSNHFHPKHIYLTTSGLPRLDCKALPIYKATDQAKRATVIVSPPTAVLNPAETSTVIDKPPPRLQQPMCVSDSFSSRVPFNQAPRLDIKQELEESDSLNEPIISTPPSLETPREKHLLYQLERKGVSPFNQAPRLDIKQELEESEPIVSTNQLLSLNEPIISTTPSLETPKEKQLLYQLERKCVLLKKARCKIKLLQRQNARLKKKVSSLKKNALKKERTPEEVVS